MSDVNEVVNKQQKAEESPPSALHSEAISELNPRIRVQGEQAELLDTRVASPSGTRIGPSDPNENIKVTVMVRSKGSEQEMDQTLKQIEEGKEKPLTHDEFAKRFGADPGALSRVEQFAKDNGLKIDKADAVSGAVQLEGKIKDFSSAFGVRLDDYKDGNIVTRARSGNIFVPRNVDTDIEGVFGLDNQKKADPQFRILPKGTVSPRDDASAFMPNQIADMYQFPKESMGAGQSVGIVELGGGLDTKDNAQYYSDHKLKAPNIQMVTVDGADTKLGTDADGEVALDTQVIGAVAPDANQQIVFAPNSIQGFVDAVTRATFPQKGEPQNTAISISWGGAEPNWSDQDVHNMDLAFKKAALQGVTVFAASGDSGAKNNSQDGSYSALFPASDPMVTGTGGTTLDHTGKETVWNDGANWFGGDSATGGGISQKFDVPDFQKGLKLPADANGKGRVGRGVPDIAGDASPTTGYTIRVGGAEQTIGGTSAVAPLYAALTMRVNSILGHPVGYINPFLYDKANAGMYKDITEGNNDGYNAGPGWDATTGWGVLLGDKFLDQLKKQKK